MDWDKVFGVATVVLGGGWLTQLVKNRGNTQTRHIDELAKVRADQREELSQLRADIRAEIATLRLRVEQQEKDLATVRLSYAVFREKVRAMILLFRVNDPRWQDMAESIEQDRHEVDDLLGDLELFDDK